MKETKKSISTMPEGVWESSRPQSSMAPHILGENTTTQGNLSSLQGNTAACGPVNPQKAGKQKQQVYTNRVGASLTTDLQGNGYPTVK